MKIERLPESLTSGRYLHCRPVRSGPIIAASIVPLGKESPLVEKAIVCPAREARSRCQLRRGAYCHYYKGDGFGYTIIGPGMDQKTKSS